MNIYKDINRARQIPYIEENAVFIRHTAPSTSRHDRKPPRPKPPRNLKIYDNENDADNNGDDDYSRQRHDNTHRELYEHEIASSIREVNGGIDYSNESLEKHWRERQDATTMSSEETSLMFIKPTVEVSNEASVVSETKTTKTDNNENVLDEENILKQCKLNKNAAIRGLLRNRKISLNDLQLPSAFVDAEDARNINVQKGNVFPPSNLTEGDSSIKLVQCPEEPDVFVRPLQAYGSIDENKYKDIDFSVPHLGKKRIITPRQFYVEMDDSDFDFVKKDTKRKT